MQDYYKKILQSKALQDSTPQLKRVTSGTRTHDIQNHNLTL